MSDTTIYEDELPADDMVNNTKSELYEYLQNIIHDDFDDDVLSMQLCITRNQLLLNFFSILPSNNGVTLILDGYSEHIEERLKQISNLLDLGDPNCYPITFKFQRFVFIDIQSFTTISSPKAVKNLWLKCVHIYDYLRRNILIKEY